MKAWVLRGRERGGGGDEFVGRKGLGGGETRVES